MEGPIPSAVTKDRSPRCYLALIFSFYHGLGRIAPL